MKFRTTSFFTTISLGILILTVSFSLTTTEAFAQPIGDYGDAPDGTPTGYQFGGAAIGSFPTLFANDGARTLNHDVVLGTTVSDEEDANDPADPDGVPNLTNQDSDDGAVGIVIQLNIPSAPSTFQFKYTSSLPVTTTYFFNALVDLNLDGTWSGVVAGGEPEWAIQNLELEILPGTHVVTIDPFQFTNGAVIPDHAWLRMALTSDPIVAVDWDGTGEFDDGEIEDYFITKIQIAPGITKPYPKLDCVGDPYLVQLPIPWFSAPDIPLCKIKNYGGCADTTDANCAPSVIIDFFRIDGQVQVDGDGPGGFFGNTPPPNAPAFSVIPDRLPANMIMFTDITKDNPAVSPADPIGYLTELIVYGIGGVMDSQLVVPPGLPSHWLVTVTDPPSTVTETTIELGSEGEGDEFVYIGLPEVVGGEHLPIETTSLLIAGVQSFSWMIPVVLSVLGIGLFAVSRKSE